MKDTDIQKQVALWKSRNVGMRPLTWVWTSVMCFGAVVYVKRSVTDGSADLPINATLALTFLGLAFCGFLMLRSLPYYPPKLRKQLQKKDAQQEN